MSQNPLLSIVVAVYNGGKFLAQFFECIEQQQLESYELILVNDGSTDNSLAVIDAWRDRMQNVTLIQQENQGVSVARNSGLAIAKEGGVLVDYATNPQGAWQDLRKTDRGIYEKTWAWTPTEEYYVGGGPGGGWQYAIQGKAPEPEAGATWKTTVRVTESHYDGTESGGPVLKYPLKAVYSFQDVKEAKLSGCTGTIPQTSLRSGGEVLDLGGGSADRTRHAGEGGL